jgi:hypothetical protein
MQISCVLSLLRSQGFFVCAPVGHADDVHLNMGCTERASCRICMLSIVLCSIFNRGETLLLKGTLCGVYTWRDRATSSPKKHVMLVPNTIQETYEEHKTTYNIMCVVGKM